MYNDQSKTWNNKILIVINVMQLYYTSIVINAMQLYCSLKFQRLDKCRDVLRSFMDLLIRNMISFMNKLCIY